jgi:hypothetical protein
VKLAADDARAAVAEAIHTALVESAGTFASTTHYHGSQQDVNIALS